MRVCTKQKDSMMTKVGSCLLLMPDGTPKKCSLYQLSINNRGFIAQPNSQSVDEKASGLGTKCNHTLPIASFKLGETGTICRALEPAATNPAH
uniref:Uncharacterized protein n=1 Tax=Setaria italica TaxID=4555 RepID=K3YX50_SETIT